MAIRAGNRDAHACEGESQKQRDHHRASQQPEVLPYDGEDEVAFRVGQVAELLPPLPQTAPEQPTRPDGDQRLGQLIPFVAHLRKGVAEGQKPLAPVGFDPGVHRAHAQSRHAHQAQVAPPRAGQQHHQHGHDHDAARCGEVWLLQNEQEHHRRHDQKRHDAPPQLFQPFQPVAQRGREIDHRGDLGYLGWLKAHARNAQPAPRSVEVHAYARYQHQHKQNHARRQPRHHHARVSPEGVGNAAGDEHQNRAQSNAHQLALDLQKRVALIHRLIVSGAEQRQKAAHHQQ